MAYNPNGADPSRMGSLADIIASLGLGVPSEQAPTPSQAPAPQITPQAPPQDALAALGPLPVQQAPNLDLPPLAKINNDPRGLFGIHGTARDILGILGDAFLVQSGNKPIYGPQKQRELESAALGTDFTSNPLAAANRLAGVNPNEAMDFSLKADDNQRQRRKANEDYNGVVVDRAMRMLSTANKDNYPQVRDQVENYVRSRGVTLPVALPDSYSEEGLQSTMKLAIPVDRQVDDSRLADSALGRMMQGWARIDETGRHNGVTEGQGAKRIDEYGRHNQATEGVAQDRVDETGRHNQATEGIQGGRLQETGRHNQATEGNTVRGQNMRDARAERTTSKQVAATVRNSRGEVVTIYKDGTTQTHANSRPVSGKLNRDNGPAGARPGSSPSNPVRVKTREEALALPKGTYFVNPNGQPFQR